MFTLGNGGFVRPEIITALGLPRHVRQARVLIAAENKGRARTLVVEALDLPISPSNPEFRQAMGNDVDALSAAGLLDAVSIYVLPLLLSGRSQPVVQVAPNGTWWVAGLVERRDNVFVFERTT